MKKIKTITVIFLLFLYLSCEVFLGQDADTSDTGVLYSLWKTFAETHAYIDIKMDMNSLFDSWEDVYLHYNNLLTNGNMSLFNACGDMLKELMDPHVFLYDDKGNVSGLENKYFSYYRGSYGYEWDVTVSGAKNLLNNGGTAVGNNNFVYGTFKDFPDIGYLYISSFDDSFSWIEKIDDITEYFNNNTRAVIIDVRYNYGGLIPAMEYIASRFTAVQKSYAIAATKNGPGFNDFSAPMAFRIAPAGITYTRDIVLLTNKASISAAEWFALALRTQPHVKHAGLNTCGALSMRTLHLMINGWYYSTSAYKVTDMNGKCYEGFGVRPHKILTGKEDNVWEVNPSVQLLVVLDWLSKGCKDDYKEEDYYEN